MHCITCDKNKYPLCSNCSRNPYFVEKARRVLAQKNGLKSLKQLYSEKYAEIKNYNTNSFWNIKFSSPVSYANEPSVTKERIKIAASYIPKKTKRLLDIGTGVGLIEEYLGSQGKTYEIYGIDISQKSVNILKKKFKGDFRKGSVYSLPYGKNSFDVVLALEVLEHISPSKILKVLGKVNEILKPGGVFICSVPLNERMWGLTVNESSHLREYSPELLERELTISGFRPAGKSFIYAFPDHYVLKSFIARNILTKRWDFNDLILSAKKI